MADRGTVFIVTVVRVLEVRLGTEMIIPPLIHLHSCLLAGNGVEVEAVTEGMEFAVVVAHIINAVLEVVTRGHHGMALAEWAFRVSDQATECIALELPYLGEITIWTVVCIIATVNTPRSLCNPPALSQFLCRGSLFAILHQQIVLGVLVVVSTKATHSAGIDAWDFDPHCSIIVIIHRQPKDCFDLCKVTN